jgi:cytidylate kinase
MIIAIDGPAGSGKTTIAKLLASKLNIAYFDTGATYRALTLKALRNKVNLSDETALGNTAKSLNVRLEGKRVYLDNREVSDEIRTPLIDKNISLVVSYPKVRKIMVELQRSLAQGGDSVVEGRDITTVVFPQAEFKFYLDARPEIRAERRFKELNEKGLKIGFNEVNADLSKRDHADKNRKVGALTISEDAIYLDTTHLSIEEVAQKLLFYIKKQKE